MQISKCNSKCKIITITVVILIIGIIMWFYQDYQETQKSVLKVESKLVPQGFDNFYQKQGNKFCLKKEIDEQEQRAIVKDLLWVLEKGDYRSVKEVECEKGKGIEIK